MEGNTPYHLANTMDASQQEDTDELKARASSPIIADYIQDLAEWGFNNQDHTLLWDSMCLVIEADERGEFEEHIDMLEDNYESEEGNAPIQDPMEFGEMANWTPLDGSEGLKRKRAETFEADFDYYYISYNKARGMEILDRLRTMNSETKSQALDWLIDNGFLHSEEVFNSAYINAMGDALYITSEEDDYDAESSDKEGIANYSCDICDKPAKYNFQDSTLRWEIIDDDFADKPMWSEDSGYSFNDFYCGDCAKKEETSRFYNAESPSATIPVNEPSWVKPAATALGFALGFLGIHEIKKVL